MRNILFFIFILVLTNAEAQNYQFIKKINLTGDGKWDYLKFDRTKNRLFVSHQDRVNILDLKKEVQIAEITGLNNVHGIALAKDLNKGYITNGGDNNITIFDYNTLKVIKTLNVVGKKADAIMFDKFSNQVFVFNNGSGNSVVINAKTDQVVGVIELGGAPEFAVTDEKGTVYNNNEDTQEISVIDAKTNTLKARYSLLPNEVPTGLAIDIDHNRLFSVCRKTQTLVVMDAANGKIIATLPIGGGVDAVVYDKTLKMIYTSNGEGNVTIVKQESADKYSVIQTLQTKPGCKTMVHNEQTHQLYLSGADYKEGTKDIMPNTFGVLIYGINIK